MPYREKLRSYTRATVGLGPPRCGDDVSGESGQISVLHRQHEHVLAPAPAAAPAAVPGTAPAAATAAVDGRDRITRWLTTVVRNRHKNSVDPISLEALKSPVFRHVNPTTGFVYGFAPEPLVSYFILSGNFTHPLTRDPFNIVEIRRLSKLVSAEQAVVLMTNFSSARVTLPDVLPPWALRHPPGPLPRDAESTLAMAASVAASVSVQSHLYFFDLVYEQSVFSIVGCMLEMACVACLNSEVFEGNVNDVISIYVLIMMPMVHAQSSGTSETATNFLPMIEQALALVEALKLRDQARGAAVYNNQLMGVIIAILRLFLPS